MNAAGKGSDRVSLAVALGIVSLASIRFWFALDGVGLIGWDTYPLIELNRAASPGDLIAIATRPLMGPDGAGLYYRPVLSLLFAVDHGLWGLWVPGYHFTTLLVFAAAALSVHRLALRALGPAANAAALVALAFFVCHPVHATVLPVAARRADLLSVLFMSAALASQIGWADERRSRPILAAAFAGLALLSKESAFLLPLLMWLVAFLSVRATSTARRAYRATMSVTPTVIVVAAVLAARWLVLGAIVGDRPTLQSGLVLASWQMLGKVLRASLEWGSAPGTIGVSMIATGLFAVAVASANALARRAVQDRSPTAPMIAAVALAVVWLAEAAVLFAKGLILPPWYIVNPVVPVALLLAAGIQSMYRLNRVPRARIATYVAVASAVALCATATVRSPLVRGMPRWTEASQVQTRFLDLLERELVHAPDGTLIETAKLPMMFPRTPGGPLFGGLAIMAGYSAQAWAELKFPKRRIRMAYGRNPDVSVGDDEIVVHLGGRR